MLRRRLFRAFSSVSRPEPDKLEEFDPRRSRKNAKIDWSTVPGKIWNGVRFVGNGTLAWIKEPKKAKDWWAGAKVTIVREAKHYWLGTKLLVADTKTAWRLFRRVLKGDHLTRRERRMMIRTSADLFRLVPFSFFVIVPFAEFSLPFFLN